MGAESGRASIGLMAARGVLYGTDRPLVESLARALDVPMGSAVLGQFADGERHVEIRDRLVGETAVLVVATGPPVDSQLMTLALLSDACRRAGARRIVAVMPYMGYARGDRLSQTGQPVAGRLVLDFLQSAGMAALVVVDWHNPALAGFTSLPVVEVSAMELLASRFRDGDSDPRVVVAPDAGGIQRASRFAAFLRCPLAIALKCRMAPDEPKLLALYGDVQGRRAIIVDDMISTGKTVIEVAERLREAGAVGLAVAASHAVMASGAEARLRGAELGRVVVTNSLPFQPSSPWSGWECVELTPLLAPAIRRLVESD